MSDSLQIIPVTRANLLAAQALAEQLFPDDNTVSLQASVEKQENAGPHSYETRHGISRLQYWLGVEQGKPVGLIGLYGYPQHPKEVWLGWFGVLDEHRGKNVGKTLMSHVKAVAKSEGARTLRCWSVNDEESQFVNEVYYPRNRFITEEDVHSVYPGYRVLVHSLNLEDETQPPRVMWKDVVDKPVSITGYAYEVVEHTRGGIAEHPSRLTSGVADNTASGPDLRAK